MIFWQFIALCLAYAATVSYIVEGAHIVNNSNIHRVKLAKSIEEEPIVVHHVDTVRKPMHGSKWKHPFEKNLHLSNKQILGKLGLSKVRMPSSHNRKRLAVESRRHARPDDSHMVFIKLPPNLYYYNSPKVANSKNSILPDNGKKVNFNYFANGKPGRIYHWNLPAIKKIISEETHRPLSRSQEDLIDIKNTPTWPNSQWENETIEKSYGKSNSVEKKSLKRKSPSYYAPTNYVSKNNFHKYFPGNGKPKGFYVITGHKKPVFYKNIIA